MNTTGVRKAGEFCWFNILTADPKGARQFFSQVLGWAYSEIPGVGHTVQVGGHPVGGLFDVASPQTPKGTPAMIGAMVKVESAEATSKKIVALGGKAQPPMDLGDTLRMAVCHDPDGAKFDLWEPKKAQGTDVDGAQHGAPSWFALMTPDAQRAAKFYAEVFGWGAEPVPSQRYMNFKRGSARVAGMMQSGKAAPDWVTFFAVRDAQEALKASTALGAKLAAPLEEVAGVGRLCGIASPQGLVFHVIEYAA